MKLSQKTKADLGYLPMLGTVILIAILMASVIAVVVVGAHKHDCHQAVPDMSKEWCAGHSSKVKG